jgi:Fe-S cluster biogenesis protein NfuA
MSVLKRADGKTAIEARIRDVIVGLRPLLHIDPAGLELVDFDVTSGVAVLRVDGDCPDCTMSVTTLLIGIEAHLKQRVPEIRAVRCANSN